ncbi:Crp/Fnr family transcriptional regulator [Fluviicola sp.]|uniref:Crp/Fnr family transcriptional regulator n=1 Tax=Fluviicola sp. TaxID=1917219 RepID=UPI0031E4148A
MFDILRQNLSAHGPIAPEDLDRFTAVCKVVNVKRKKQVLSEGNIPNFLIFVHSGLIRMYTTDKNMNEHTFDFGSEGTWFGDIKSFRFKQPTDTNIEAIEDSQLLVIAHEDLKQLYATVPGLERVGRINAEDKYIQLLDRLKKINHSNYSAEERYQEFLKFHGDIAFRIPNTYIASYLGIATETLSRIRKNMLHNNQ